MFLITKKRATTEPSFLPLPQTERQTLQAVCVTLVPALTPRTGDDPELLALSADRLNVVSALEQSLAKFDPAQQQQFRKLLRFLERPFFIALLIRKPKGFSRLTQTDRLHVLQTLAVSKLEKLRMGFQAIKRLALFTFYSTTDAPGA